MYIRKTICDFANCKTNRRLRRNISCGKSWWGCVHRTDFRFRNSYPWSRLMPEKEQARAVNS